MKFELKNKKGKIKINSKEVKEILEKIKDKKALCTAPRF